MSELTAETPKLQGRLVKTWAGHQIWKIEGRSGYTVAKDNKTATNTYLPTVRQCQMAISAATGEPMPPPRKKADRPLYVGKMGTRAGFEDGDKLAVEYVENIEVTVSRKLGNVFIQQGKPTGEYDKHRLYLGIKQKYNECDATEGSVHQAVRIARPYMAREIRDIDREIAKLNGRITRLRTRRQRVVKDAFAGGATVPIADVLKVADRAMNTKVKGAKK